MKQASGYLIIEVLIAIVILSMVLFSIFSVIRTSQLQTQKSNFDTEASLLLQEEVEVAHSVLITSEWDDYNSGLYHPYLEDVSPSFTETKYRWSLDTGKEENVNARFSRWIEVYQVCRDSDTGTLVGETDYSSQCSDFASAQKDENSKLIKAFITWDEKGSQQALETKLLIVNPNLES